jgi:hypothetical protein
MHLTLRVAKAVQNDVLPFCRYALRQPTGVCAGS